MDKKALGRLWTIIGSVNYVLAAWIHGQGGGVLFGATFVDDRQVPNAYFSIIIGGTLTALICLIGARHAQLKRAEGARPGLGRMPVSVVEDADAQSWDGFVYQAFFLVVFVLIPLAGNIHFWDKLVSNGHVFSHPRTTVAATDSPLRTELFSKRVLFGQDGINRFCIAHADSTAALPAGNPCEEVKDQPQRGGPDWLPIWSPLLLALPTLSAWAAALWFAFALFGSERRPVGEDVKWQ